MTKHYSDAYNTGFEAAAQGELRDANPYSAVTWEHDEWFRGFDGEQGSEYQIAFTKTDGEWDVVETFTAANEDAANEYVSEKYADDLCGEDWFILDANGKNINGGE